MARGLARALALAEERGSAVAALQAHGEAPAGDETTTGVALGEFISATSGSWVEAFALGTLAGAPGDLQDACAACRHFSRERSRRTDALVAEALEAARARRVYVSHVLGD